MPPLLARLLDGLLLGLMPCRQQQLVVRQVVVQQAAESSRVPRAL